MGHNGHIGQINLWFLNGGGAYPFINHLKTADGPFTLQDNSGVVSPSQLNAQGFYTDETLNTTGVYGVFWIPDQTARPGNYVVRWTGTANVNRLNFSNTIVSGSQSGSNGRFVLTPTGSPDALGGLRIDLGYKGVDHLDPITSMAFIHENDEADYLAGRVFSTHFKNLLANFGVIRFLDWLPINRMSGGGKWIHRKPIDYVTYGRDELRGSLYRGTTTNVGDAYTLNLGDGGSPVDKDVHLIQFNASASGDAATLNGVPIRNQYGDVTSAGGNSRPLANSFARLHYDADLGAFLKYGGCVDPGSRWLDNGVPPEICLQLCSEIGAHPWLPIPAFALDPMTDYTTSLATYIRDNMPSWMIPRFEPCNEVWNSANGFDHTRYGWNKAFAHWGSSFDAHNWYGKVLSTMGEAVSNVYGNNRARYWVVGGVQSVTYTPSITDNDDRFNSTRWVAEGGGHTPAKNWATHICQANYWGVNYDDTAELLDAFNYNASSNKPAYITAYINPQAATLKTSLNAQAAAWKTYATGFGLNLTNYEGGIYFDYKTGDHVGTITGATQAAQCVLTITSSIKPPAGSSVTISGVAGMTQLNGNTYTVVSVVGNAVTINVNSSGFSAYTSGGSATYVNSMTLCNNWRRALKACPDFREITRMINQHMYFRGALYPSAYSFTGFNNSWSKLAPDEYGAVTGDWNGYLDFSSGVRPIKLIMNTSA